jgi:uncharacterized protein (DUF433 family)
MAAHERVEISPEIMFGKPVIRGTRIPVELILRKLAAGQSPEEILRQHPRLTAEDIRVVVDHAGSASARSPNPMSGLPPDAKP